MPIVVMQVPLVTKVIDGETWRVPRYVGPLESETVPRWERVDEDATTMTIRLYIDDPAQLGRLRAKPDVREVQ